jgi:tetratricopeptide (TPR) repeat protein
MRDNADNPRTTPHTVFETAAASYGQRQFEEALAVLIQDAGFPSDASLLNLAGACCIELRRDAEAERYCRCAIDIAPHYANAHNNLGIVFRQSGRFREAEEAFLRVLDLAPDNACAHTNLGRIYEALNLHDAALAAHRRAIECQPELIDSHANLGVCLMSLGRFDEAASAFETALSLGPDRAVGHFNLGTALKKLGRFDEAEKAYRRALALDPAHVDTRLNLAHLLLGIGKMEEGWALFEVRYEPGGWLEPPATGIPMWRGESLEGQSLIVWTEQGFGDSLQFCRYLPLLRTLGVTKLTFACPAPLRELFTTIDGVDACITVNERDDVPHHDYQCLLMSLPLRFGTTLATVPAALPYLHVPPRRAQAWRGRLPQRGFKVGLVWAGDPRAHTAHLHAIDRQRSLSAQAFLPVLRMPGVTFISLQKGVTTQPQIHALPAELRPLDLMDEVNDFADTAAIVEQLDLVISVDTSVAHLAGALNRPVWILSRHDGCWRWLYQPTDVSPWYPKARLFRQTQAGRWDDVIAQVAHALQTAVQSQL